MKHIDNVMKTNVLSFRPMSPCLRLFIQTLLAEQGAETMIEELLHSEDAITGSAAVASSAPLETDNNYKGDFNENRIHRPQTN